MARGILSTSYSKATSSVQSFTPQFRLPLWSLSTTLLLAQRFVWINFRFLDALASQPVGHIFSLAHFQHSAGHGSRILQISELVISSFLSSGGSDAEGKILRSSGWHLDRVLEALLLAQLSNERAKLDGHRDDHARDCDGTLQGLCVLDWQANLVLPSQGV